MKHLSFCLTKTAKCIINKTSKGLSYLDITHIQIESGNKTSNGSETQLLEPSSKIGSDNIKVDNSVSFIIKKRHKK